MPTAASTFSTPGLGSAPKVGAPAPGLPAPAQGQASWDAARPTHHGDSHRGRASAGPAAGELGLLGRSLLGELQKLVPLAKKRARDTQALTGANGNP